MVTRNCFRTFFWFTKKSIVMQPSLPVSWSQTLLLSLPVGVKGERSDYPDLTLRGARCLVPGISNDSSNSLHVVLCINNCKKHAGPKLSIFHFTSAQIM